MIKVPLVDSDPIPAQCICKTKGPSPRTLIKDQSKASAGVDPGQVAARETVIMNQAHAAVSQARGEIQRVISQAETEVRALQSQMQIVQAQAQSSLDEARSQVTEAQARAHSIESRASVSVREI